ncbi:QRFP-like peptide receptor isoform X1 [Tachypleus tridentatus]|uniref:QRFP-like peptide receptor isoform X1 n=2 Tax=Tachypleus tridentatus TaxID=6853 RepID=UPI003FD4CBB3
MSLDERWLRLAFNFTGSLNESELHNVLKTYDNERLTLTKTSNLVLIIFYVVSFLVATSANTVALLVFYRYRQMRHLSNVLLITLAVADLLVALVCMPTAVGSVAYRLWIYGDAMCKMTNYLQGVAVSASIFTMTLMSIDKYVVICHPLTYRQCFCRRHFRWGIIFMWILAAGLFIPVLIIRQTGGFGLSIPVSNTDVVFVFCVEAWKDVWSRRVYGIVVFVLVNVFPAIVMTITYSKIGIQLCHQKLELTSDLTVGPILRKQTSSYRLEELVHSRRVVARRFVILTLVFAICWVPYNLATLLMDFPLHQQIHEGLMAFLPFALFLGHANSAINPLLYCWLNHRFGHDFLNLLRCRKRRTLQQGRVRMEYTGKKVEFALASRT